MSSGEERVEEAGWAPSLRGTWLPLTPETKPDNLSFITQNFREVLTVTLTVTHEAKAHVGVRHRLATHPWSCALKTI